MHHKNVCKTYTEKTQDNFEEVVTFLNFNNTKCCIVKVASSTLSTCSVAAVYSLESSGFKCHLKIESDTAGKRRIYSYRVVYFKLQLKSVIVLIGSKRRVCSF